VSLNPKLNAKSERKSESATRVDSNPPAVLSPSSEERAHPHLHPHPHLNPTPRESHPPLPLHPNPPRSGVRLGVRLGVFASHQSLVRRKSLHPPAPHPLHPKRAVREPQNPGNAGDSPNSKRDPPPPPPLHPKRAVRDAEAPNPGNAGDSPNSPGDPHLPHPHLKRAHASERCSLSLKIQGHPTRSASPLRRCPSARKPQSATQSASDPGRSNSSAFPDPPRPSA